MPTTATYSHYYSLGNVDPLTLTNYPNLTANVASTTLTDDEDGTADGDVALNGTMSWSASSDVQLIGVTDAGYPVVHDSSFYYILTDRGDLQFTPLVINQTSFTMCFAAGSLIETALGELAVEDLRIGDSVRNSDGRDVDVKWIGRQTINKFLHREFAQMVRINRGALGHELPHRDLVVTGDHGMILDGLVIHASALVNGSSIDWVPMDELPVSFTVYHIELQSHDVIRANGAETETFVDAATRQGFDNYQEYLDLYGTETSIPEMMMHRIPSARLLPMGLRDRLGLSTQEKVTA